MIDFVKENVNWLDVLLVRNEVQHIVAAADPEEYPDRYPLHYYLELQLPEYPQATSFEPLIRLEGRERPARLVGGAEVYEGCAFRIEKLLEGQLSLTPPQRGQCVLSVVASLTTPYRLRELVEPGIRDVLLPAGTALRAGLALRDFVGYGHRFFSRYQAEKRQFLTWQPNHKLVSPAQEEFLYFLLNLSPMPTRVQLRVQLTHQDGSRQVLTSRSLANPAPFQVVCAPVGMAALQLPQTVRKYEVWLSDENNERFTEVRTYYPDYRPHRYERFLLFANSLGGFDTLRLLGRASQETDVTKSLARREREAGHGLDFSELEVIALDESSGIELSTGFFEQSATTYLDYLRELLLSELILLDTPHGFEAMSLLTTNLNYQRDDVGLIERTFQLQRTYADRSYSRLEPVEPLPTRPTVWRGVGNVYLLDAYGKRTGYVMPAALRKYYQDTGKEYVPLTQKPNVEGDPDYVAPSPDPDVTPGDTPYPSAALSRPGTFVRTTCPPGEDGGLALISIPAGKYGGEKPGDADLRAEAEYRQLNTQAYANQHGSCALAQNYAWDVPEGHFHFRTNLPAQVGVYRLHPDGMDKGNIQALQGRTGAYIFPTGSNDLDFPAEVGWYFHVYGTPGQQYRQQCYHNGVLRKNEVSTVPAGGSVGGYLFDGTGVTSALDTYAPASGDRFLLKITLL